ncbi:MAG: GntR family transcriptional regulator [Phycisphaerales bacterium]|nr:GntR family transcriptional regulator [Phycisphaerales bacterium]
MSVPLSKTKHFQLTMHLREQVQAMQPGQVLPTFKELCELHRVSQATLERALDRLRAEGLLHRVEGTRRLVASTVCDPARHRVAIIRPDWPSLLFHNMVQAVADAGRSHDWAISLVHYRSLETLDITRAIDTADAAILIPTSEAWPEHFRRALYKPHRPVVVLQNMEADCPRPSIRVNDQRVGELAVEHLAELGHRRIALLQDQPDTPSPWRVSPVGAACSNACNWTFHHP